MGNKARIQGIVRAVLERTFEDIEISDISVRQSRDEDGDKILIINVVFDGKAKRLDASKTSRLLRHIIPEIAQSGESGFPILSFIAKSELRKKNPAAA